MVVTDRGPLWDPATRYYAQFRGSDIKDRHIIISTYGTGSNTYRAITDYWKKISEKVLVIDYNLTSRKVIVVPKLKDENRPQLTSESI